jgi:hypothetical protein
MARIHATPGYARGFTVGVTFRIEWPYYRASLPNDRVVMNCGLNQGIRNYEACAGVSTRDRSVEEMRFVVPNPDLQISLFARRV